MAKVVAASSTRASAHEALEERVVTDDPRVELDTCHSAFGGCDSREYHGRTWRGLGVVAQDGAPPIGSGAQDDTVGWHLPRQGGPGYTHV